MLVICRELVRQLSHMWMSHVIECECVVSHVILRHVSNLPRTDAAAVTYTNESCRTDEWVVSHVFLRHVSVLPRTGYWDISVICWKLVRPLSRVWRSHVIRVNESGSYEWVTSPVQMSPVTCITEKCHVHEQMSHTTQQHHHWSHTQVSLSVHMNESCPIYEWVQIPI